MIIVGLFLALPALIIMIQVRKFNIGRVKRALLNFSLIALAFVYLTLCLTLKTEPFVCDIQDVGDVFMYSSVIFVFSPFLWIVLFHFCSQLFRNKRVRRNARIKSNKEFIYYRDDLDKISPSLVMYTSMMDIDMGKAVSAVILKLKLLGHIEEVNDRLRVTDKNTDGLLESEKLILSSVSRRSLHEKTFRDLVKKETLANKYIKKNNRGVIIKIVKMLITIITPFIILNFSIKLDEYVFENYHFYKEDNGIVYIKLNHHNEEEIEKLYYEVTDQNDYHHSTGEVNGEKREFYNYTEIRADRLEYSVVRYANLLNISVPILFPLIIVSFFASLFNLIAQIIYFNKNYTRTAEGKKLLNKAYALKNYLKDYSLMKDRTQDELILWEYYMIYAVILDVNTKIENDIVENYLNNMSLN